MALSKAIQKKIKEDALKFYTALKEDMSAGKNLRGILEGTKKVSVLSGKTIELWAKAVEAKRGDEFLLGLASGYVNKLSVATEAAMKKYGEARRKLARRESSSSEFNPLHTLEIWERFFTRFKGKERVLKGRTGEVIRLVLPVPQFSLSYRGLRGVVFDNLTIGLAVMSSSVNPTVESKRGTETHKGTSRRRHPHIDGIYLCFGEGSDSVCIASNRRDIIGMHSIILNTLRTYNHPGAYQRLCNFTDKKGGRCGMGSCNVWIPREKFEEMGHCKKCSLHFCKKCTKKFRQPDTPICEVCKNKKTKKRVTPVCSTCAGRDNLRVRDCSRCSTKTCQDHRVYCRACGCYPCLKCSTESCSICRRAYCLECAPGQLWAEEETLAELKICRHCSQFNKISVKSYLRHEKGFTDEMLEEIKF